MNKKLFLGMFAAATMLFATSCSNDELDGVQSGNEATISFNLGVDGGVQTRAISDGLNAKKLVYAVYNSEGELIETISGAKPNGQFVNDNAFQNGLTETVSVTLAKGQEYTVAFWAQNGACDAYNTDDLKNVTVTYNGGKNNDETRDAFFASTTFFVVGSETLNVKMKRPFAQINLGVYTGDTDKSGSIDGTETYEDWEHAVASQIDIETSKVIIKNAATSINLLDGSVSGHETVTYKLNTIPAKFKNDTGVLAEEWLEVDTDGDGTKENYKYLSMSYILADPNSETGKASGESKTTLNGLQFTLHPATGKEIVFDQGLTNVPVQRNWRTNIIGKILTGDITFNITIDPLHDGEFNVVDGVLTRFIADGVSYDATADVFTISNEAGLTWLSTQTNAATKHTKIKNSEYGLFYGQTVKLANNVDMNGVAWTPISATWDNRFAGTFDGGGKTISNLVTSGNEAAGLFGHVVNGTVKNVNVSGAAVSGTAYAGGIAGQLYNATVENCRVENSAVKATSKWARAAGIASMMTNSSVNGCSVVKTDISCPASVGGLAGITTVADGKTADQFTLKDNTLSDVNVVCDQTTVESSATPNAGELVGRRAATLTESGNTLNNVQVYVIKGQNNVITVNTADDLKAVAAFVNAGNSCQGLTVSIENDIDLKGKVWTPIGENRAFQGSIDGKNHTIKNIKGSRGLIHLMSSGTTSPEVAVKNLTLENVEITNSTGSRIAAFVGDGRYCTPLKLENLTLKGKVTISGSTQIAGIYAASDRQVIAQNIKVEVTEDSYIECTDPGKFWAYTGGVFGRLNTATLENINSNIDVKSISNWGIGGLVGRCMNVTGKNLNCTGDVIVSQADESVNFTNAEGTVIYAYQGIGRIIGYHGQDTYTNCKSTGKLTIGDKDSNGLIYTNTSGEKVSDSRFGSCHSDRGWTDKVITIID